MTSVRIRTKRQGELWKELDELEECRNPTLQWILHGFDEKFEEKLDQLKTTWNQKIRAYYRDALSLSTKKAPILVTYKLDDNGTFVRLIEELYPNLDFAELVALRRYIAEVKRVKSYFTAENSRAALFESRMYAESQLEVYDLKEIIHRLFDFYKRSPASDIFGRYSLTNHRIEIYIIPCIIFSMLIEEDFLDMAVGTLAHELAHGFHHVGSDKDGEHWQTFGCVEFALVEGLAEYYTREFARTIAGDSPHVLRAFEKTSKYLPEEYRRYEEWGEGFGLEAVHQAFIEARRNDVRGFDEFQEGLHRADQRLGSAT